MEAEFDRPWWQHARGARYKRLTLDAYAGGGVGDDALANNCAKILDNLLRQDLGINAGSCFNHAVRAANGVLPQSVIKGIDYVRQQRNDVMHTLGVFRLQDPDRFVACVNATLDAIEGAVAAKLSGKPGAGGSGSAAPARGGGGLASGNGRQASEQRDRQQEQRQQAQQQQQQQQQAQQQLGQQQSQQRDAARLAAEAAAAEAAAAEAASRREAEKQQREAAELLAAEEASRRDAEQQWIEEAEFESQLAAALQASLQQEARQQRQQQAAAAMQQSAHAPAAQQRQGQHQGQTPLGQALVDLTADSDDPPAKRRRCSELGAGLEGRPCWLAGSPCEIIVISSQ